MKKLIFVLCLCFISSAFAQEKEETYDLLQRSYQQRVDLLKIQDNLLKALLNVPFEKRVYIYPALFESKNMPKKIVTHPQIIVWKGKKPTKIAPQMQEFAKEHLNYMPAKFYPLLDPDGWPKQNKENDWHNVGDLLSDTIITPNTSGAEALLKEIK